ncbi:Glutathione synthetase, chloroplastic [Smittium mucronatum]|uniref:Glutathione synthetase n=1 Tax=Smittium mucronatum TaxID=133383 RepID=A0A1R0H841_9FUNG|nr:Glutathione synthetase, chloroplastic [Smittium mucronatum]
MSSVPTINFPPEEFHDDVIRLSNAFLTSRGVLMNHKSKDASELSSGALFVAPVTLVPGLFYKECFERAVKLQTAMNLLYHKVSNDSKFLIETFSEVIGGDEFSAKLFDIYKRSNSKQTISLGINRSDYLLDETQGQSPSIKQVEFNAISVSFSSLTALVGQYHRFLNERTGYEGMISNYQIKTEQLPENTSLTSFSDGLASAFIAYGNPKTHEQIHDEGSIDPVSGALMVSNYEIAIAYFRSGYVPEDYPTQKEWDARMMIESSLAIKCPNIAYHLVGAKKVQQELASPGVVERYISDPEMAKAITDSFAELLPLDSSPLGRSAYEKAMTSSENYVMKPQREGGGCNTYGADIPPLLKTLSVEQQKAYILMRLIKSPQFDSLVLHNGKVHKIRSISELGVYGVWLSDGDKVMVNKSAGHLLRTKPSDSNEGGVASGFAFVDSPLLI